MPAPSIVSLGECLVELTRRDDGSYQPGFAGDTFNALFYAQRLGVQTGFVSALGDDLFTPMILEGIRGEGIDTSQLPVTPGRRNGLYFIETDAAGERSFHYWRVGSAATQRLKSGEQGELVEYILSAGRLLISGITLAIVEGADLLEKLLREVAGSTRIFLDANHRPALWSSVEEYRARMERVLPLVDTFLPSREELKILWPAMTIEEAIRHCQSLGVRSVVVKMGADGCLVEGETLAPLLIPRIIDTTGAGDAFNGGYMAGLVRGLSPRDAAALGQRTAAKPLQVRGAIDHTFAESL